MDPISLLKYLLSNQYEPEEESPQKFFQSYQLLASHRDDLQEKYEAKAKRRAEIEASKGQIIELNHHLEYPELIVLL